MTPESSARGYETAGGLCRQAREFLQAAERTCRVDGVPELLLPFYYLIGHSLELAFKAALLHDGVNAKQFRKYGHDLEALAKAFGERDAWKHVEISGLDIGAIRLVNIDYVSKRFEYSQFRHSYQLPITHVIYGVAQRLVEAVRRVVDPA